MPELPEVETMRRGVLGVVGSSILAVEKARCRKRPITIYPSIKVFRRRAVNRRITAIDRIGKRVVVRLDNSDSIVMEPRMTGLVLVAEPPSREHLRVRFRLEGKHSQLLFWDRRGLGTIRLFSALEMKQNLGPSRLGPDALAITADQLRDSLKSSRRAIKVALLDQRVLAGIGNLYASELLHVAGLHPEKRCNCISRLQWQRILSAISEVLEAAIRCEGSTLGDGTYRNALNDPGGYQNHHRVYDRAGQKCPTCQQAFIQRIVQSQRSTFFCPRCQRK